MRLAAEDAGLGGGSRGLPLLMVLEPEAAALYVHVRRNYRGFRPRFFVRRLCCCPRVLPCAAARTGVPLLLE